MKKVSFGLLSLLTTLSLVGCSTDEEATTLKVGATAIPHAEVLEQAKPMLAEKGINLEVTTFQDYVLPNTSVEEGELDANYFQHIPYLEGFNEEHGTNLVNAGGIHIEPIGVYSKNYQSLEELPDSATIIMSNSVADHGRMLALLQTEGLIKLSEDVSASNATVDDIVENPIEAKKRIGYLPEIPPLYLDMVVWDYLEFVYELKKVKWLRGTTVSAYGMAKAGMLVIQSDEKKIVLVSSQPTSVESFANCELLHMFETILEYNTELTKDNDFDFWYESKD